MVAGGSFTLADGAIDVTAMRGAVSDTSRYTSAGWPMAGGERNVLDCPGNDRTSP
jgi:hypothetical protein